MEVAQWGMFTPTQMDLGAMYAEWSNYFQKKDFVPKINPASSLITKVVYTLIMRQQSKFKKTLMILGTTAAE